MLKQISCVGHLVEMNYLPSKQEPLEGACTTPLLDNGCNAAFVIFIMSRTADPLLHAEATNRAIFVLLFGASKQ
jgi:hypothetical protein